MQMGGLTTTKLLSAWGGRRGARLIVLTADAGGKEIKATSCETEIINYIEHIAAVSDLT